MKKMNILFIYPKSRKKIQQEYIKNKAPSTFFYGQKELVKKGENAYYFDFAFERWNILRWIFFPFEWIITKFCGIGFKLDQALLLLNKIKETDLIISTSDSAGLPIAFLKSIKLIKTPLFYTTIGLTGQVKLFGVNRVILFFKMLLKYPEKIICYSLAEKKSLIEDFKIPMDKILFFTFCTDTQFYKNKKKLEGNYVLVVGRDLGRDYALLLKVAKELPDISFKLICSPRNVHGLQIPKNVEIEYDVNFKSLREKYQKCRLVVLPLKETSRASGQIVLLEAMASGKAVIVSSVIGLSEVYDLKSGENCLHVPVGDGQSLKRLIRKIWSNSNLRNKLGLNARKTVEKKYNQQIYGNLLLNQIRIFFDQTGNPFS